MPVNNCILEYVKKDKSHFADFFYLASEAWIVCRILSKVKNELKIYIIYICDFGIDISITHVCILMEELYFEFKKLISLTLRDTLERTPKLSVTKVLVGFDHDADFDADHDAEILCKRITQSDWPWKFLGRKIFPYSQLGWCSPLVKKWPNLHPSESPPPPPKIFTFNKFLHYYYLKLEMKE